MPKKKKSKKFATISFDITEADVERFLKMYNYYFVNVDEPDGGAPVTLEEMKDSPKMLKYFIQVCAEGARNDLLWFQFEDPNAFDACELPRKKEYM